MKDEKKLTVLQDAVTQKVVNTAIPGFFKQPAQWMDTEEGKGMHPMGTPIKRKPEGDWSDRFVQSLEMATPGLRQLVPATGEKGVMSKEELESPKYKELKDVGVSVPGIRTRVSYQIKPDENHPKGIMNPDEFKKFSELVTKYSKQYTDEALGYKENIYNIKTLKSLISKNSDSPKIQSEITIIKKELQNSLQRSHENAISAARNELGLFTK
jgi:hypothetical protein